MAASRGKRKEKRKHARVRESALVVKQSQPKLFAKASFKLFRVGAFIFVKYDAVMFGDIEKVSCERLLRVSLE